MTNVRAIVAALFIAIFSTASLAHAAEPKVPDNVLMKPTFLLANQSWSGGTAFLVQAPDKRGALLVTCHHLFGPATGRDEQMSGEQIRTEVRAAIGLSMQDTKTVIVADRYVAFKGARGQDGEGAEKDLAAFAVKADQPPTTLEFAEDAPRIGQLVYMFARLRSEAAPRLLQATITQVEPNWLLYTFKERTIDLAGTSGAPILNEAGKVIGMNVGGNDQNGEVIGAANPATRMKENLASGPK